MSGSEVRILAVEAGVSINGLAREAGVNEQVVYRKGRDELFAPAQTLKLRAAAQKLKATRKAVS